jgi:hypothetical protein
MSRCGSEKHSAEIRVKIKGIEQETMDATTANPKTIARAVARVQAERWFVWMTISAILLVTTIPYLYGYLSAPPGKQFMGIMLDVPDHVQYFSWMRDLSTSNLVSNKMTPEPNKAIFFNLLWWMLGRLGVLLGAGYPLMYQVLRLVATALFLWLAYRVCAWFLDDLLMRRTAFLTIALTSGLGWILVAMKYTVTKGTLLLPLDVFVAEGNTFLDVLGYAHFVAAALYISIFLLMLFGQIRRQYRYAVAAGLLAMFFGWQHAYDLVLVWGILGAYIGLKFLRDRRVPFYLVWSLAIIGAISIWPALYSVILTRADPVWKQVLAQFSNAGVYTPNPLQVPILMGIPFLLALYTVIRQNPLNLKAMDDNQLFLVGWFLANFALIYIPTDFQIHMLNGWQVPIAILAVQGLFRYILPWATDRGKGIAQRLQRVAPGGGFWRRGLAVMFILLILPTNLYLWGWRFLDLKRHDYPYYLHKDEVQAMSWMSVHSDPNQVVLSSLTTGQYVPALTGMHAFLAHWAQTLDFYGKEQMVQEFFSANTSDAWRVQILRQYHVEYILYGPAEKVLGSYQPQTSAFLQPVFSSPNAVVYQVISKK